MKDKVTIITGSSRGLGKVLATHFAREGAKVVVAARTEVENQRLPGTIYKTAEEIKSEGGYALPVMCDVTSEESVAEMVNKVLDELGQVDILVNNAGTAFPRLITETPLKRWELVLRVNLTGAFLCSKAVIPWMKKRKRGSIVNITSVDAITHSSGFTGAAYAVSKAAALAFVDPELMRERAAPGPGVDRGDVVLATLGYLGLYPGSFVVAGLDAVRFGPALPIPQSIQVTALLVFALGYGFAFWAVRSNRFFATFVRIQDDRNHSVVSSGPYALVRHPGERAL